jgi:PAS domain S-box-containing protein
MTVRRRASDRIPTPSSRAEQTQLATFRISEAAPSSATLDELFREIHRIVGELMPATNYIAMYDATTDVVSYPASGQVGQGPKRSGRGLTAYVLRTGEPLLADKTLHRMLAERGDAEMIGSPSIQWLGVPLTIGDKAIGVLAVQSYTPGVRYGEAEERMLTFVSAQIAMTIERKRAEVALRDSEARLARAQETAHLGSWELDLSNLQDVNRNPLWWSDEVYRIFGYAPGEVTVSNELFFKSVPPEDIPRISAALQGSLQHGMPYLIQHRVIRPDGSERVVEERSTVLRDEAGRPTRMVGTVLDVTDRQRLEEQLRQARRWKPSAASGQDRDFNNLLTRHPRIIGLLLSQAGSSRADRGGDPHGCGRRLFRSRLQPATVWPGARSQRGRRRTRCCASSTDIAFRGLAPTSAPCGRNKSGGCHEPRRQRLRRHARRRGSS